MFPGSFKAVKVVLGKIEGHFKEIPKVRQGSFKGVSRKFQDYFKNN